MTDSIVDSISMNTCRPPFVESVSRNAPPSSAAMTSNNCCRRVIFGCFMGAPFGDGGYVGSPLSAGRGLPPFSHHAGAAVRAGLARLGYSSLTRGPGGAGGLCVAAGGHVAILFDYDQSTTLFTHKA